MQLQRESMSPFVMQRKLNNRNAIREGEERLASGDGIKLLQFHGEKAKLLRSVVFKTRQKIVQLIRYLEFQIPKIRYSVFGVFVRLYRPKLLHALYL
jgi:hypothetical protein